MTWVALLLADPSPLLRRLVLRDLLGRPADDPELAELAEAARTDRLVADLVASQAADGGWSAPRVPGAGPSGRVAATALALRRLAYVGLDAGHDAVRGGCDFLYAAQRDDGAWPLAESTASDAGEPFEGYTMIPLQTARPLQALAACGLAGDPRSEAAYAWLLAQRLADGAWPTGKAGGNLGRVAGYRRLPHSRWGCRSNTTAALACLALHPELRGGEEARRALDLLLGRETRERHTLGFEVARTLGLEPARGVLTYYARFDLAQVLDLCWRVGATMQDERVASAVAFVRSERGPYGLWTYAPRPEASRWLTFDLLRSLERIDASGDWVSLEPRTPFQAYPHQQRRH